MSYCAKCGNELGNDELYCSKCGAKVSDLNVLIKEDKKEQEVVQTNKLAVIGFIFSIPAIIFAIPILPVFLSDIEFRFVDYNVLIAGIFIGLALGFSIKGFIRGIRSRCHKKIGFAGVIISGLAFVYTILVIFFIVLCFGGAFKGLF